MAKKSIIERELKRENLTKKYAEKRKMLKLKLSELYKEESEGTRDYEVVRVDIEATQNQLDSLPRNSKPTRQRNRCKLTGRSRGVYRDFKMCRNMIRKFAMMGYIPGIRKSSW